MTCRSKRVVARRGLPATVGWTLEEVHSCGIHEITREEVLSVLNPPGYVSGYLPYPMLHRPGIEALLELEKESALLHGSTGREAAGEPRD